MKRFLLFTKAMFLIHLRNRVTLFWNLVFPVFILLIYAIVFGKMQVGSQNYMIWVTPGVVVFNMLTYGLLSSSTMILNLRENGVLRRLQASPLPSGQLIGSFLIVNVLISLCQSAIILLFSVLVFKFPFSLVNAAKTLPVALVGVLTFVAIGQLIGSLSPTSGVAVAVGQLLNFGMMFVTDTIMPMQLMPAWVAKVAHYLPAYAVAQLVRPPLMDGLFSPEFGANLLVAALYILLSGLAAAVFFRWEPRG